MEVDKGQKVIDDRVNNCWSFGSDYRPSSQPRKMSIGIMIDSLAEKKSGDTKEDEVVMPEAEQVNSKRSSFEGKTVKAVNANGGRESETTEQVISPWITKHQKPPISETVLRAEKTVNLPTTTGKRRRLNRKMNVPVSHTVEFFSNQASTLHGNNEDQNKFGGLTYKRKDSKKGGSQRTEEFKFATTGDVTVSDNAVKGYKSSQRTTEALKMKLWEILGTVSSPRSQPSASQAPKIGANNSKKHKILDEKGDVYDNPRQNSDTIETDSESPGQRRKRPATRSLTRRRASNKLQFVKNSARPSSTEKQKVQQKNVFSFERLFGRRNVTVNSESRSTRKKSQTRSHRMEPSKILFSENNNIDNIAAALRTKTSLPAEKIPSLSCEMGNFCAHSHNKREYIEAKNSREERDSQKTPSRCSHQSPGTYRADRPVNFNSTEAPEEGDQQEIFHNSPLNIVDSQHDFESPTFKMDTRRRSCSHSSAPETDQIKHVSVSPAPENTGFTTGNFHNLRNLQNLNADCLASDTEIDSADGSELSCSPPKKSFPFTTKKNVEDNLSGSLSGDAECESTENGTASIEDQRDKATLLEEPSIAETSKFILHPTKRAFKHQADKDSNFHASSPSPNVVETSDWMLESLEENQEDELERVAMLLSLGLKNFKKKMNAATRKKSSEILMSVYEEIQSQLQNIESQIQSDQGKLISLGKSKRKSLETRFQEQQVRLKLIHDKFRHEIHRHLQEWQDTLEGQEEHQNELKGTAKEQKASHQKLLAEAEETIATQINDAERRITAVHKLATERQRQLGYVIAGCLNDGILG